MLARAEDTVYPEGRVKLFGKRYSIFVGTGFYRPSAREAREVFGPSMQIRLVSQSRLPFEVFLYRPKARRGPSLDFGFLWKSLEAPDGDRVRVIPPPRDFRVQLVDPRRGVVPFVSLQAGPYFRPYHQRPGPDLRWRQRQPRLRHPQSRPRVGTLRPRREEYRRDDGSAGVQGVLMRRHCKP